MAAGSDRSTNLDHANTQQQTKDIGSTNNTLPQGMKTPTISEIRQDRTLECQVERLGASSELFISQSHVMTALQNRGLDTKSITSCQSNGIDAYKVSFKPDIAGLRLMSRLTDMTIPVGSIFKMHFRELGGEVEDLTVYNVPHEVSDGLFRKAFTNFGNARWCARPKMQGMFTWVETGLRFVKLQLNPETKPPDSILFMDELLGI